ncbi:hypothetical protein B0H14DRAFT_2900827 [Mycena olivaceomarginata]|nr:hypothetical protein B0H14DRAFT_2900827 [Mycena olivaceomarginata]
MSKLLEVDVRNFDPAYLLVRRSTTRCRLYLGISNPHNFTGARSPIFPSRPPYLVAVLAISRHKSHGICRLQTRARRSLSHDCDTPYHATQTRSQSPCTGDVLSFLRAPPQVCTTIPDSESRTHLARAETTTHLKSRGRSSRTRDGGGLCSLSPSLWWRRVLGADG